MEEMIVKIMQLLKQEYKFFEVTNEKIASWIEFLGDIPQEQLYGATVAYISDGSDKVPTWGTIRKKALLLGDYDHLNVSASYAWGRILIKIKNKDFKLSDLETRALACTCDIFSLRRKDGSDLGFERSFFVRAYEELKSRELQKVIIPKQNVNLLESNNTKSLEN